VKSPRSLAAYGALGCLLVFVFALSYVSVEGRNMSDQQYLIWVRIELLALLLGLTTAVVAFSAMSVRWTNSIQIARDPEAVAGWFDDPSHFFRVALGSSRVSAEQTGSSDRGTLRWRLLGHSYGAGRWRSHGWTGPTLEREARSLGMAFDCRVSLTDNDQTRVDIDGGIRWWWIAVPPLQRAIIRSLVQRQLRIAKAELESR
jgi:hypothetical protein